VADANDILSPRRLRLLSSTQLVYVGGRVCQIDGNELELADAFASVWVELSHPPSPAEVGLDEWVVVKGHFDLEKLRQASVQQRFAGRLSADSDSRRLIDIGRAIEANARAQRHCRRFFDARGYLEVTTPVRVEAPGTDVYIEPHACERGWLITSPEFHMKRLLAGGCDRIYQLARCTRDGEHGPWHQPEFTLLEWYEAFCDVEHMMATTEQLVRSLAQELQRGPTMRSGVDLALPFERLSVADAFEQYAGVADVSQLAATDEDRYFQLMVDRIEPALSERPHAVFLCDYPSSQAALARKKPTDPRYAERFELFVAGVELCNGYGELTEADEQRERFTLDVERRRERGARDLPIDESLLAALADGLPPCSGNALGLERLLALLLGSTLEDTVAFPRTSS
jgi:lysyl-tRNA synthetase class 2